MEDKIKFADRVKHIGRDEEGKVVSIKNDGLHVEFEQKTPRGNASIGIFDEVWFRMHPDLLVNLSSCKNLDDWRRAGQHLKPQQTPGRERADVEMDHQ
jgi:hypothetical protein